MGNKKALGELLQANLGDQIQSIEFSHGLHTVEILPDKIISVCEHLRDDPALRFEMLIDVCGVDYLYYGMTDWETEDATNTGYSRGVEPPTPTRLRWQKSRFAAVYHLLSITHNHRVRLRVLLDEKQPRVPSVTSLWASANWFEREAFDLFGIFFDDHPDLRRLLTDYGFDGHPFRKDFPVVGRTQVRYSAQDGRVIQEPVTIPDRELVPKVIRQDNRYWETK